MLIGYFKVEMDLGRCCIVLPIGQFKDGMASH